MQYPALTMINGIPIRNRPGKSIWGQEEILGWIPPIGMKVLIMPYVNSLISVESGRDELFLMIMDCDHCTQCISVKVNN